MRAGPARALSLLAIAAASGVAGCGDPDGEKSAPARAAAPPPARPAASGPGAVARSHVGSAACAACHPGEAARWRGSHHDLAMQAASPDTVLGDFDGAELTHFDIPSSFRRRDGRFVVRTDGPDGALRDYEVAYTFGVEPLQQYLVPFPGGRLQALPLAWDTRPAGQGGQRWMHLHPDEPLPPGDPLHWTGPSHNWNFMCSECHATGLRRGYDLAADRYETTWAELGVGCEACHGPGSAHVAWARRAGAASAGRDAEPGLAVDLGAHAATWTLDPAADVARRDPPLAAHAARVEVEACGRCHARRSVLSERYAHGRPLLDTHLPALLDPVLYHADGQILDEVYVYGSFLQSRMYARGVTCSDCHDPHALAIPDPDASCARCHRPETFATPSHHFHAPGSPGASCVACHMPARTYMRVDARRDHSLRVPRPDLSVELGTPNACTGCHAERPARWAADAVSRWYGPEGRAGSPHYGSALDAGRRGRPGARRALEALADDATQPVIARATALRLLRGLATGESAGTLRRALRAPDALVRVAGLEAIEAFPPPARLGLARTLLDDPVRGVRAQAARVLAPVPAGLWPPGSRAHLASALEVYRAAQRANAERPESHLNLGMLHVELGALEKARRAYRTAIRLDPQYVPAYVNLADLHRLEGRDDEGERVLRRALEIAPGDADALHALGLLLVRRGRHAEALEALGRAARGAPQRARYAYAHGAALHAAGRTQRALDVLEDAHARHPADREILEALTALYRERGALGPALAHARKLRDLAPADAGVRALVERLEAARRER